MAKPEIIFHIGLERTGTTSLQRYCRNHQKLLLDCSLLYPIHNAGFSQNSHGPLAASYLTKAGRDYAIPAKRLDHPAVVKSLLREIETTSAKRVLISSEHFSSRFGEKEVRALASDFQGYDVQILIFVRHHLTRFFSAYATSIASGRLLDINLYAAEVAACTNRYIRYGETISLWEQAFGKENIRVKTYFKGIDIISACLEKLVVPERALPESFSYSDNPSLGPNLTEALRLTNIALAGSESGKTPQDYISWLKQRYFHVYFKRVLIRCVAREPRGQWPLSADSLRTLKKIIESDCRWLKEHYGVELLETMDDHKSMSDVSDLSVPAQILANALVDQAKWRRWNLFDIAMPLLIPVLRHFARWNRLFRRQSIFGKADLSFRSKQLRM